MALGHGHVLQAGPSLRDIQINYREKAREHPIAVTLPEWWCLEPKALAQHEFGPNKNYDTVLVWPDTFFLSTEKNK